MQRYSEWAPTGMDLKGLGCPDQQGWYVAPVTRTRDSGSLDESNWEAQIKILDDAEVEYDTASFGHWACGWFEIVLVKPDEDGDPPQVLIEIEAALADYPVLDDMDHSDREFEAACQSWEWTDMRDRIKILARHGLSIFAARREEIPQGLPYFDDFHEAS